MIKHKKSILCLILLIFSVTSLNMRFIIAIDERDYWPTVEWLSSTPESQNMNTTLLNSMISYIYDQEYAFDSIIIVRHGYVVLEEYPNPRYTSDDLHILYSVTKSFTSALVGIAIDLGYIESVDQKLLDFFPNTTILNLDSRKEEITLRHLLTMSAGIEWEGPDDMSHTWGDAVLSRDPIEFILNQPMDYEPGTHWYYNGGCSHLLSAILTRVTGNSTLDFAKKYLFKPLNITDVYWPKDPQGIYYGGQDIRLTPPDMAKFGYLFLNNGTWDNEQIISQEWVFESTRTSFSFNPNEGYGYQWWTYPSLNAYFAYGFDEQRIIVLPEQDLVVVFTSEIQDARIEPDLLLKYILPAVLDKDFSTVSVHETGVNPVLFTIINLIGISLIYLLYTTQRRERKS